jgi:hypothetical protein
MNGSVSGGTHASLVGAPLKGLVSYPVDPCAAGVVQAAITLG